MAHSLQSIDQPVIVITCASSGIGMATARAAAEHGAKLVLAARSEEALGAIVDNIQNDGGDAMYVVSGVSQREQVERRRSCRR